MDHLPITVYATTWLGPHPGCGLSMPMLDDGNNWSLQRPPYSLDVLHFPAERRLGLAPFAIAPGWARWQLQAMCEERGAACIRHDARAVARMLLLAAMPNQ